MVLIIPFTVNIYMFPYIHINVFDYRVFPRTHQVLLNIPLSAI